MCACVVAVHVRVCVHIHVLVSMAAADQAWRALQGPPLVRLPALNGASGRFPLSLSSPSPTPQAGPLAGSLPLASSTALGGASRDPSRCALPFPKARAREVRGRSYRFLGFPWRGLDGCCLLLREGKEKEASQGRPRPWIRCLHTQLPGAYPALTTCPVQPCKGPPSLLSTAAHRDLGGGCLVGGPQADPARAKDLCHDFGQIIPRVTGPLCPRSRPEL